MCVCVVLSSIISTHSKLPSSSWKKSHELLADLTQCRCSCLKSEVSVCENVFWAGVGMERVGGAEPATALCNEPHSLMSGLKIRMASRPSFSCQPGKDLSIPVTRLNRLAHGFWGKPQWPDYCLRKRSSEAIVFQGCGGPSYGECQGYYEETFSIFLTCNMFLKIFIFRSLNMSDWFWPIFI